jgi:hypothetical protein
MNCEICIYFLFSFISQFQGKLHEFSAPLTKPLMLFLITDSRIKIASSKCGAQ